MKEYFKDYYINYTTNKSSKKISKTVSGLYLNRFIYFRPFKRNKKYQICNNLYHAIDQKQFRPLSNDEREVHNDSTIDNLVRESALLVISLPDTGNETSLLLVLDRQARVE